MGKRKSDSDREQADEADRQRLEDEARRQAVDEFWQLLVEAVTDAVTEYDRACGQDVTTVVEEGDEGESGYDNRLILSQSDRPTLEIRIFDDGDMVRVGCSTEWMERSRLATGRTSWTRSWTTATWNFELGPDLRGMTSVIVTPNRTNPREMRTPTEWARALLEPWI